MQEQDFPALYRSADDLSLKSQKHFFRALRVHLVTLVVAAILSIVSIPHWSVAAAQLLALLGALGCSIYLFAMRPDRFWYAGRAVAESIKTITWRYVCRAEPFQGDDASARNDFRQTLKQIVEQNREVCQSLTEHLDGQQFTPVMEQMRARPLEERRETYADCRIKDQLTWYAKKAAFNRRMSRYFFWALIGVNTVAVVCAVLRMVYVDQPFWPTDVFVAMAASVLSWMQAKRFSELAASYALGHPEGLLGNPAAAARTLGQLEYITVELASGGRWAETPALVVVALRQGRAEARGVLGLRQDAAPQLAVDGLYAAMQSEARDPANPQFTDHYFTGDYPTRLLDREIAEGRNDGADRQLSFLVDA